MLRKIETMWSLFTIVAQIKVGYIIDQVAK